MGSAEQLIHVPDVLRRGVHAPRLVGGRLLLVLAGCVRVALATACCLGVWGVAPVAFGGIATTVISDSMAPGIRAGDIVIAHAAEGARPALGQVLLVEDPDRPDRLRLHRWVGVEDGGLRLQGDANPRPDVSLVSPGAVRGVGFLRVPYAGLPALWLRTGQVLRIAAAAAVVLLAAAVLLAERRWVRGSGARSEQRPAQGPTGTRSRVLRTGMIAEMRRRTRTLLRRTLCAGVVVLPVLGGLAPRPDAAAVFEGYTSNDIQQWTSGVDYACPGRTLPAGRLLHYSYDGRTDTVEPDMSGNAADGVLRSASMRSGTCAGTGRIITTASASTYVSSSKPVSAPSSFTVATWFKLASTTNRSGKLIGFGDAQTGSSASTSADRHLYLDSTGALNGGVLLAGGARCRVTAAAPVVADVGWHHAAATYSGSSGALTLYLDGAAVASGPCVGLRPLYTGYWRIGYDRLDGGWVAAPATANAYFTGAIDETVVYGRSLGDAEVQAVYAQGH